LILIGVKQRSNLVEFVGRRPRLVQQMRDDWQFYRDRRPDSYTSIPKP